VNLLILGDVQAVPSDYGNLVVEDVRRRLLGPETFETVVGVESWVDAGALAQHAAGLVPEPDGNVQVIRPVGDHVACLAFQGSPRAQRRALRALGIHVISVLPAPREVPPEAPGYGGAPEGTPPGGGAPDGPRDVA
jgi:hypothetical protein